MEQTMVKIDNVYQTKAPTFKRFFSSIWSGICMGVHMLTVNSFAVAFTVGTFLLASMVLGKTTEIPTEHLAFCGLGVAYLFIPIFEEYFRGKAINYGYSMVYLIIMVATTTAISYFAVPHWTSIAVRLISLSVQYQNWKFYTRHQNFAVLVGIGIIWNMATIAVINPMDGYLVKIG